MLALALVALHAIDRHADVPVVGEKLEHLARNPGRYDTLFVGSSYVYREFDPARFDAISSTAGSPTSSFNLGIPGMDPPETYWLLNQVLARDEGRLRLVIIELDTLHSRVRPANLHTRRFDAWHDLPSTIAAVRAVASDSTPRGKKLKDVASHIEAFVRRVSFVGRGRAVLGVPAIEDRGPEKAHPLGARQDGYVSLDEEQAAVFALRRDMFGAFEDDRFQEKLAGLRAGVEDDEPGGPLSEVEIELLRSTVERVRATGARVVLVVPPCLATRAKLIRRARSISGATVLAFNDPDQFPDLYDPAMRFDVGHLNAEGAARFTTLLAEAIFGTPMDHREDQNRER